MKDYQVTKQNLQMFMRDIERQLDATPVLLVSTQDARTGKWGMAKLWRTWMQSTSDWMAAKGATMPLCLKEGKPWGERAFNAEDAHELFTAQWLGLDADGTRLSWSKSGRDGMRPATRGERYHAMQRHEQWASERGITLFVPRDSEYFDLREQEAA